MQPIPDSRPELITAIEQVAAAATPEALVEALRGCARRVARSDGIAVVRREGPMVAYVAEDAIGSLWVGQRFVLRTCISGLTMLDNSPILIPDTLLDPRVPQVAYAGTFVRSMAMFPIGAPEPGMALGAYWRTPGPVDPQAVAALASLSHAATEALARIERQDLGHADTTGAA